MKVIIMGCGRVGEQLSLLMAGEGHDVVVIDQDPAALDRTEAFVWELLGRLDAVEKS